MTILPKINPFDQFNFISIPIYHICWLLAAIERMSNAWKNNVQSQTNYAGLREIGHKFEKDHSLCICYTYTKPTSFDRIVNCESFWILGNTIQANANIAQ